jgi:hypothetical protein
MLLSQGGLCLVCRKPIEFKRAGKEVGSHGWTNSAAIDHCHDTGVVRGILCFRCNTTLGHVYECPDILENLIEYVKGG